MGFFNKFPIFSLEIYRYCIFSIFTPQLKIKNLEKTPYPPASFIFSWNSIFRICSGRSTNTINQ